MMAEGLTVKDRRRHAVTLRATVPISEALSDAVDAEVDARVAQLDVDEETARRVVTRASIMREALELGLQALQRQREGA